MNPRWLLKYKIQILNEMIEYKKLIGYKCRVYKKLTATEQDRIKHEVYAEHNRLEAMT